MELEITKRPIIQITRKNNTTFEVPSSDNEIGIASGTLDLKRSIVDNDIEFGLMIASEFSVELYNIDEDLQGCSIKVFLQDINTQARTTLFTGIIDSSKTDNVGESRNIIAYDWIYYHRDDNMADWWNNYWENNLTQTIKQVRDALLQQLGFTAPSSTYTNDSVSISWTATNIPTVTSITVSQVMRMLCEIQGTFPYIDGSGNLTFAKIDNSVSTDITGTYERGNSSWEDFTTEAITGIALYSSSDDLLTTVGTDSNVYSIAGNLLLMHLEETNHTSLVSALNTLLTQISTIQYVPCEIKMIMANNDLVLGQKIVTEKGASYVMSNEISGSCFVEQTLQGIASASKLPNEVNDVNDLMVQGNKISKFEKTIDSISTQVSNVERDLQDNHYTKTETDSKITQTATSILTQVSETYTSQEDAIATDTLHYLATSQSSGVTTETSGWTTTIQTVTVTNKYLWTYHTYTYADGHTKDTTPVITGVYGNTGSQGPQGASGEDAKVYSVENGNQWVKSGTVISGANVWQSDSNYNVNSGEARCLITFSGFTTFTIMARSNGESNYDYLEIGKLDATSITRNGDNYYSFKGNPSTSYTAVTFNDLDGGTHTVRLLYSKDGSQHTNEDRGFFYIPDAVGAGEGIGISEVTPLYYVSNSSTAPAKPTSVITSTSTSTGAWTKALPSLSSSYMYLYTCDQVKYTDGSYGWSDVVLDNAISTSYSEIQQTKDQIVLKVDNNGNIVKVALSSDASTGNTFSVNADNISFVANTTIDLKTGKIGIKSDNFTIDKTTGNVTINGSITCTDGKITLYNSTYDYTATISTTEEIFVHDKYIYDATYGVIVDMPGGAVTRQVIKISSSNPLVVDGGEKINGELTVDGNITAHGYSISAESAIIKDTLMVSNVSALSNISCNTYKLYFRYNDTDYYRTFIEALHSQTNVGWKIHGRGNNANAYIQSSPSDMLDFSFYGNVGFNNSVIISGNSISFNGGSARLSIETS